MRPRGFVFASNGQSCDPGIRFGKSHTLGAEAAMSQEPDLLTGVWSQLREAHFAGIAEEEQYITSGVGQLHLFDLLNMHDAERQLKLFGPCGAGAKTAHFATLVPRCCAPDDSSVCLCTTDKYTFADVFESFTGGALRCLPRGVWDNLIVHGSSVVAGLLGEDRRSSAFRSADIDVMIHSLDRDGFVERLRELKRAVAQASGVTEDQLLTVKLDNTVVFYGGYPIRSVQVLLELMPSVEFAVSTCDLDCCAVAYDGAQVLAPLRALTSYRRRWNVVSQHKAGIRGEQGYKERLMKYARRGFAVVDHELYPRYVDHHEAELCAEAACSDFLVREAKGEVPSGRGAYRRNRAEIRIPVGLCLRLLTESRETSADGAEGGGGVDDSVRADVGSLAVPDKQTCEVLPYGPQWSAAAVRQRLLQHQVWAKEVMLQQAGGLERRLCEEYLLHTDVTGVDLREVVDGENGLRAAELGCTPVGDIYSGLARCMRLRRKPETEIDLQRVQPAGQCSNCGFHNRACRKRCRRCNEPRVH
eukprot:TRINITY_DN18390_c0_g1_i1.p1 TRINITY_DN18390_c0_g1~~TRINITY_DN18390_c0_g1_i1.p1  ORF type:complete len:529 (+),score=33.07 TRINITY_DN18390_c0_g1_i1:1091-2677(+)